MAYLRDNTSTLEAGGVNTDPGASAIKPHIIPGVLYPAVSGKLMDGIASHSGAYGTAQADSFKYYYTDIKGSKPIKDPRIGTYFGSQRHRISSTQLLEQETAMHGDEVYSIDGRKWMRCTGGGWSISNDAHGNRLLGGNVSSYANMYIEVVGYFNGINISQFTDTSRMYRYSLDGATEVGTDYGNASVTTPLENRFLECGSLVNIPISTTLGIHTIKLRSNGPETNVYNIELIAQDTTSLTTKHQMQMPSQNVVSFGKKFTVGAETKHYNPFAFKTDGSTVWASGAHNGTAWPIGTGSSTNIDTATSLGLAAWVSTNYYKPYNGGRVVKWIASDGTIKTSVNVMPPNAQSILGTDISNKANATIANNTYHPTFEAGPIRHSQAEVAKTFHWREFGNGAANGGTLGTRADATMVNASNDNIAYVLDDGLTSLNALTWQGPISGTHDGAFLAGATTPCYITFIGTGISINFSAPADTRAVIAQNLPYGTHILKILYHTGGSNDLFIDGVQVKADGGDEYVRIKNDITFHQPKMPPIPEDAVVIADYMLMADFVQQTVGDSTDLSYISKGVRYCSSTRDVFYKDGSFTYSQSSWCQVEGPSGDAEQSITAFTDNVTIEAYDFPNRHRAWDINGTDDVTTTKNGGGHGSIMYTASTGDLPALGINKFGTDDTGSSTMDFKWYQIASPIHSSSHYQAFETPYTHDLLGGDRNIEQTNLVVTPDGKTWDEVTRDTSYIGNCVLSISETGSTAEAAIVIWSDIRGWFTDAGNLILKDSFAHGYDRQICLKDGSYKIVVQSANRSGGVGENAIQIWVNGTLVMVSTVGSSDVNNVHVPRILDLKRLDYVQIKGGVRGMASTNGYYIFNHTDPHEHSTVTQMN